MKKLTERQKRHNVLRQINSLKKRLNIRRVSRGKLLEKMNKQRGLTTVELWKHGVTRTVLAHGVAKKVPEVLNLTKNYEETARWLTEVRDIIKNSWQKRNQGLMRERRVPSRIGDFHDFSLIKSISVPVALIIASEYDRAQRTGGYMPGAVNLRRWDPKVRRLLEGVGFLAMTGVNAQGATFLDGDGWRMLRFRSGSEADGPEVGRLLTDLGVPEVLDSADLYGAIIEAITNTRQHAYPAGHSFPEPHFPGWWMTGLVDRAAKRVTISLFDHGLSIPGTLPSWDRYPLYTRGWKRLLRTEPDPMDRSRDGTAIAIAMMVGRTSTKQGFRGKGLPAIDAMIDRCPSGSLAIYSGAGSYRRMRGGKAEHDNHLASIGGTLVTWQLGF